MDNTGLLKNGPDPSGTVVEYALVLSSHGFRTQYVVSVGDIQKNLPECVRCQAFVVSEWVEITAENFQSVLDGTYKKPAPVQFDLDNGDTVETIDGKIATVSIVYYDRYHTGSSPDLVRFTFEDGTTRQGLSTSAYIAEKLAKVKA